MSVQNRLGDVERFRSLIADRLGLAYGEDKRAFLGQLLDERVSGSGNARSHYLDELARLPLVHEEFRALVRELTVCETYFFRNYDQFRALIDVAIPTRLMVSPQRRLALLSAACASGEEAYSLAMMLRTGNVAQDAAIHAVDINAEMIERARAGRYSAWSLRETSPELKQRWFRPEGKDFQLDADICQSVRFEQKNIAAQDAELWQPERYDVIFCRNVLMYFTHEHAEALIERITRALVSGGYLFLGYAETLRAVSSEYDLCHTHDSFYYQKKPAARRSLSPSTRKLPPPQGVEDGAAGPHAWTSTWIETVQRASDRIGLLAQGMPVAEQAAVTKDAAIAARDDDLAPILTLMREERFSDALRALQELPERLAGDRTVLLLRASLLSHVGKLELAEEASKQLLGIDGKHAGAHYLLGICREGSSDQRGAIDEYRLATYLDPSFAMPRLRSGMLSRRCGDREHARRELAQALVLLQSEEDARLLLFAGGFSRHALLALCRAELNASGGSV